MQARRFRSIIVASVLAALLGSSPASAAAQRPSTPRAPALAPKLIIKGLFVGMTTDQLRSALPKNGWSLSGNSIRSGNAEIGTVETSGQLLTSYKLQVQAFTDRSLSSDEFAQQIVNSYAVKQLRNFPSYYQSASAGTQSFDSYRGTGAGGESVTVAGSSWVGASSITVSGGASGGDKFD